MNLGYLMEANFGVSAKIVHANCLCQTLARHALYSMLRYEWLAWANCHYCDTALTLYKSRRAIYTCPARLRLSLVHPRHLFRLTAQKKAGPLIKTSPPLSHHSPLLATKKALRGRWRWPGERAGLHREQVVAFNLDANANFLSNYVSTTKYNIVTFVPKFLFG